MQIVGYHINDRLACDSDSKLVTDNILDLLYTDKGTCIKVLYHMDYSVACLLKHLQVPKEACKQLLETTDLDYNGLRFQYIPNIWFSIKDLQTKQWVGFSDMSQYAECLLVKKQDNDTCIEYASKAKETGIQVYNALIDINLHPKSLTSPIAAYNKEVLYRLDLPTMADMPLEAAWYAYKSCKGSWVECYKRGHFKVTCDTDLRSAYGSELSKLLDIRQGTWKYSTKFIPTAYYGYCKCLPNITADFHPIAYNNRRNSYTPTGEWYEPDYYTKGMIDFVTKYKLGTFEFIDGWFWFPNGGFDYKIDKPLTNTIKELYTYKEQNTDTFTDNIIKRVISGIWGRMLQTKDKTFGDGFMPCWASEVQNNIKIACAKFVLDNNMADKVLSVMVDGVLFNTARPPVVGANNGNGAGSWKVNLCNDAIIVSSGVQCIKGKRANSHFAIDYDWLTQQIDDNPKAVKYTITGNTAVSLQKALVHNRFEDLGKIETMTRDIEVDYEAKRFYKLEPSNGIELVSCQYDSEPRDISTITKELE